MVPETVGAHPIKQIDDFMRQGYTNIQIEDILIANSLPRHRRLNQDRRKIVEVRCRQFRHVQSWVQQPRTMDAMMGAINPQNTANLTTPHPTITPIIPPTCTGADRLQTTNPTIVPPSSTYAGLPPEITQKPVRQVIATPEPKQGCHQLISS